MCWLRSRTMTRVGELDCAAWTCARDRPRCRRLVAAATATPPAASTPISKRNCQEQTLRRRTHHDLRMSTLPLRLPQPRAQPTLRAAEPIRVLVSEVPVGRTSVEIASFGVRTNRETPLNGREGPAATRRQTPPLGGELARARRAPEFPSSHRCTSSRWSCRRSGEASCRRGRCGHRKTGLRGAPPDRCPGRS